jgi:hypothetical protein
LDRAARATGLDCHDQIVRVLYKAGATFKKTRNTLSRLENVFDNDPVVRKVIKNMWPPQYKDATYTSFPRY